MLSLISTATRHAYRRPVPSGRLWSADSDGDHCPGCWDDLNDPETVCSVSECRAWFGDDDDAPEPCDCRDGECVACDGDGGSVSRDAIGYYVSVYCPDCKGSGRCQGCCDA